MKRRSRNRRRVIGVVSLGVVVLAVLIGVAVAQDRGGSSESATPDITLTYFDGSTEQLSDLVGRPVVLNFWASWCPACISEMPAFGEVHRQLGDKVEFVGINMQEVDLEAAAHLVDQTRVGYRLAHDPNGSIFQQFGGIAMPTTVFIGEDGSIVRVHSGTISEADLLAVIESDLLG